MLIWNLRKNERAITPPHISASDPGSVMNELSQVLHTQVKSSTYYQNTWDTNKHLSVDSILSHNRFLFTVTPHLVSLPPLICGGVILHSLLSCLATWPLLCHFTEPIKLSVRTPRKSRGIWFTVCPLLQRNVVLGHWALVNRRRREDTAESEPDWFLLRRGGQW